MAARLKIVIEARAAAHPEFAVGLPPSPGAHGAGT